MDADTKKKWTDALRSGKYAQCRLTLKNVTGEFCCLGVLCEVSSIPIALYHQQGAYNEVDKILMGTGVQANNLVALNDGYRQTFKQIADFIDENVKTT